MHRRVAPSGGTEVDMMGVDGARVGSRRGASGLIILI